MTKKMPGQSKAEQVAALISASFYVKRPILATITLRRNTSPPGCGAQVGSTRRKTEVS